MRWKVYGSRLDDVANPMWFLHLHHDSVGYYLIVFQIYGANEMVSQHINSTVNYLQVGEKNDFEVHLRPITLQ